MLEKIIDWSIANKLMVILATVLVSVAGLYAVRTMPLDAIPDLSDVQVIIFTGLSRPVAAGRRRSDHLSDHHADARGALRESRPGLFLFGFSFVYVIFEDGTDMYWAEVACSST